MPPHFGEETHLLFVLWGASHSAVALGSRRDEKAANEEAGTLAQKTAERLDPRRQSGSMPEAETLIRSEHRPSMPAQRARAPVIRVPLQVALELSRGRGSRGGVVSGSLCAA